MDFQKQVEFELVSFWTQGKGRDLVYEEDQRGAERFHGGG